MGRGLLSAKRWQLVAARGPLDRAAETPAARGKIVGVASGRARERQKQGALYLISDTSDEGAIIVATRPPGR